MADTTSDQATTDPAPAVSDPGESREGGAKRRRPVRLVVAGLVVAGLAGVGAVALTRDGGGRSGGGAEVSTDDDPGPGGATDNAGRARIVLVPVAGATAADGELEEAVGVVRRRAQALGVADVEVTRRGDELVVEVPEADRSERLVEVLSERGELRFRPVLNLVPVVPGGAAPDLPVTPPGEDRPDDEVTLADTEGQIYVLGPALATGRVVESAAAEVSEWYPVDPSSGEVERQRDWQVALTLRPGDEGIDRFNLAATACSPPGGQCPTGQLAIVLDSLVQSAPTIQQPRFERDAIVISGSFSEAEAQDLALVLSSGSLPVDLEEQPAETGD